MAREEAIAEAKHRQALDPDASWITASRDGEWTVVSIVVRDPPELSHLRRRRTKRRVRGLSSLSSGIWGWAPPGGLG
jgi:hypothetical protein